MREDESNWEIKKTEFRPKTTIFGKQPTYFKEQLVMRDALYPLANMRFGIVPIELLKSWTIPHTQKYIHFGEPTSPKMPLGFANEEVRKAYTIANAKKFKSRLIELGV
jgi:hypothetical protein